MKRNHLLLDLELLKALKSIPATLVYSFIDYSLSINKKPTLDFISKETTLDRNTVAKAKRLLKEKGLLKQRGHKPILYPYKRGA